MHFSVCIVLFRFVQMVLPRFQLFSDFNLLILLRWKAWVYTLVCNIVYSIDTVSKKQKYMKKSLHVQYERHQSVIWFIYCRPTMDKSTSNICRSSLTKSSLSLLLFYITDPPGKWSSPVPCVLPQFWLEESSIDRWWYELYIPFHGCYLDQNVYNSTSGVSITKLQVEWDRNTAKG